MQETFITIVVILIVGTVFFIVPLAITANQNDNITQTAVQTLVSDFVNTAAKEAEITIVNYDEFNRKLYATGNSYSVELEVRVLDDNPGEKGNDKIGENISYSVFTSTIEEELKRTGVYKLKKGYYVIAKVKNINITTGTELNNFIYRIMGIDTTAIEVSASALVTADK